MKRVILKRVVLSAVFVIIHAVVTAMLFFSAMNIADSHETDTPLFHHTPYNVLEKLNTGAFYVFGFPGLLLRFYPDTINPVMLLLTNSLVVVCLYWGLRWVVKPAQQIYYRNKAKRKPTFPPT